MTPADYHPRDLDSPSVYHNSVQAGERFVNDIYEAWKTSPDRDQTLLLITFDEHGGTYDHVSPPFGYGLRVPTLLVSTHLSSESLRTHTCSTFLEHASVLRSLHDHFQIEPLTERDAKAPSLPCSTLFESRITLSASDCPRITPISFENVESKLSSLPLRGHLAQTMVEHFLEICKKATRTNREEWSAIQVLRLLQTLRAKHKVCSHLFPTLDTPEEKVEDQTKSRCC